jgi:aspartyl aminopeptidase
MEYKTIELGESMIDNKSKIFSQEMLKFIDASASTYHVVKNCSDILDKEGFERLNPKEEWGHKKKRKILY